MQDSPSNYPKEYADQEQQLLAQISSRRKAYMKKMNSAEQLFGEGEHPLFAEEGYSDQSVVNKLFK
jgi:hypothetical protein